MEITKRRYGEDPRLETRAEANETVKREIRYRQILDCLEERGPSTAKQVAVWLCMTGQTPTSERNLTAPRLTELCKAGLVEPIGKTRCVFTGKTVTVYGLREEMS
jgi:hypothetical protein